jgi:hypothetical protein
MTLQVTFNVDDLELVAGRQGRIVDLDPDTGDLLVLQPTSTSVPPLAETTCRYRLVAISGCLALSP